MGYKYKAYFGTTDGGVQSTTPCNLTVPTPIGLGDNNFPAKGVPDFASFLVAAIYDGESTQSCPAFSEDDKDVDVENFERVVIPNHEQDRADLLMMLRPVDRTLPY